MKLKTWIIIAVALVMVAGAVNAFAATRTLKMNTSYPSQSGQVDKFFVGKQMVIPCYKSGSPQPTQAFAVWVVSNNASCI